MNEEAYGYLGKQLLPEQQEYQDLLKERGIPYEERSIFQVGTWSAPLEEVHYRNPEGQDRYVYILTTGGADYSGQTCYAFSSPIPDDQIGELLANLRIGQVPYRRTEEEQHGNDHV